MRRKFSISFFSEPFSMGFSTGFWDLEKVRPCRPESNGSNTGKDKFLTGSVLTFR